MNIKTPLAAMLLGTLALPAAADWTASNSNGGSGSGSTSCSQSSGQRVCDTTGSWTTQNGRSYSWDTRRTYDGNGVTGERRATGPKGQERVLSWRRDR